MSITLELVKSFALHFVLFRNVAVLRRNCNEMRHLKLLYIMLKV